MIESHLQRGPPGHRARPAAAHGVSVTDACISLAQTLPVLEGLAAAVRARRQKLARLVGAHALWLHCGPLETLDDSHAV